MPSQSCFIGRQHELTELETCYQQALPQLVVIKGRRRIGKSRLITEFAARHPKKRFWSFSGLAPQEGVTSETQRHHFARQLCTYLNQPIMTFIDWFDAFNYLTSVLQPGDIILFDEISWMAWDDPTFVPKLKDWWDKNKLTVMCI